MTGGSSGVSLLVVVRGGCCSVPPAFNADIPPNGPGATIRRQAGASMAENLLQTSFYSPPPKSHERTLRRIIRHRDSHRARRWCCRERGAAANEGEQLRLDRDHGWLGVRRNDRRVLREQHQ